MDKRANKIRDSDSLYEQVYVCNVAISHLQWHGSDGLV